MNRLVWRTALAMLVVVALAIAIVPLAQRVADWRTLASLPDDFKGRVQKEMGPPHPPPAYGEPAGPDDPNFFQEESRRLFDFLAQQRRARNEAVVVGLLLAVGVAGLLALWLSRSLVRPIEAVSGTVKKLATGDWSVRIAKPSGRWPEEARELATDFNSLAEALERYEGGRQAMLADTAHELRNPLAAMQLRLEAMGDGIVPASKEELAVLQNHVALLTRLVQDLRTLSLAESHHLQLEPQDLDAGDLAKDVMAMLRPVAAKHGVELVADVEPATVRADPARLQQVVMNLLDNAIAVSPEGGVVTVRVAREGGTVRLSVSDQGPGIRQDELDVVFERFVQGHRQDTRRGSGLGLAIVKAITTLHGGTVTAASNGVPGEGAVLGVVLPAVAG
ncbi:MAG: HAMP domain-containing histidine kinase [Trueperaceae bacterium]|nr:HAMP domain-containing histidine kinase [Trueperaceae bacterium]MCW5818356.1 HAMP domain-containing histidine kinase [Trueperaceae bacterium]